MDRDVLLQHGPKKVANEHTFILKDDNRSVWPGFGDDEVIIGGSRIFGADPEPTLTVMTSDGIRAMHKFATGTYIRSGICIDKDFLIINVKDAQVKRYNVYGVRVDLSSTTSTTLHPTCKLPWEYPNKRYPGHLFRINPSQFGLYNYDKYQIDIFNVKVVLDSTDPKPTRTVQLDRDCGCGANDYVSIDKENNFCISSRDKDDSLICIFSPTGDHLRTVGTARGKDDPVVGGRLYRPVSVQCYLDGSMSVVCDYGDTHLLDSHGAWSVLKEKSDVWLWECIFTKTHMWCVPWTGPEIYVYKTQ